MKKPQKIHVRLACRGHLGCDRREVDPLVMFLLKGGILRFSQIMDRVKPENTLRMLTKELRELEIDGLVTRKVSCRSHRRWNILSRK